MYKIKTGAIPYLEDNGFHERYDGAWVLRFPVYYYKRTPLVFAIATLWLDISKEIRIDVTNNSGTSYFLWYQREEYGQDSRLIKEIEKNIDNKMHKIGARHYEDR